MSDRSRTFSQPALLTERAQRLRDHYERQWLSSPVAVRWPRGPIAELPSDFVVLVFPPGRRPAWTYATCCMSQLGDTREVELHLLSPIEADEHIELLTAAVHYHRTEAALDVGHIINFGRPWLPGSRCDRGLISLPYLDGPSLELLPEDDRVIRCLWLVPITTSEARFAEQNGLEALERLFEKSKFNYLDPNRESVA